MKPTTELLQFIEGRISTVCTKPLLYGGTAAGANLLLHCYFELWAEAMNLQTEYGTLFRTSLGQQEANGSDFVASLRKQMPSASERDIACQMVQQWQTLHTQLQSHLK